MTKIYKGLVLFTLLIALSSLTIAVMSMRNDRLIYFVNNGKLYEGFNLKIEYEKQIQSIRIQRKNMLDSVELTIKQLESKKMEAETEYAKEFYMEKLKSFEQDEENLLSEYNKQIWTRLNKYAEEFSKEKKIDILFGASGNGTLLHANEAIDMTSELILYANSRYAGK
jgi:outer membrane protein